MKGRSKAATVFYIAAPVILVIIGLVKVAFPQRFGPPNYLIFVIALIAAAASFNILKSRKFHDRMHDRYDDK